MKTILFVTVAALISLSCGDSKPAKAEAVTNDGLSEATISVPTVKCGSCVRTVTKALTAVDGVGEARVDKGSKIALVRFDAGKVKLSDLESAIAGSGYDANDTKRDAAAYEKLDDCCK